MPNGPLILASRSPRRRELLSLFDLPFRVREADVDETPQQNEPPQDMTRRLARMKAERVHALEPGSWVLGGDTTVVLDGRGLGKPSGREEAIRMLESLSDRWHEVITAITLAGPGFLATEMSRTQVEFISLSNSMMTSYCDTGEPYDKAGGYGIQGRAGIFVREIRGSYSGVVGLPLAETRVLLHRAGLV